MADDAIQLFSPDGNLTEVSVDAGDGTGPVTYRSDATGKLSNVDARHADARKAAGFTTGRTTASTRDSNADTKAADTKGGS